MKHTVVIGGGMAGLAAAYRLSRMGVKVTLIESDAIGGLAASFEHEGRFMPRSYHHILSKDRTLVGMLRKLGIYRKVRWKHVKLVFWIGKRPYDLSNPADLLLLPLNLWDKTVLIQFLLRCFVRGRWREIHTDARSWLDSWANRRVREVMFEPMAKQQVVGVVAGKKIPCDSVVSTVPVAMLKKMVKLKLPKADYVHTVSCIVGTKQKLGDFYWMVNNQPKVSFGGIFQLTSLNPTLSSETVLNFFTNVDAGDRLLSLSEKDIMNLYAADFERLFKRKLAPEWFRVFKIPYSSPKFVKDYVNPPVRTGTKGLYLAGAYKEYPKLTSTGTALYSGLKAAVCVYQDSRR